MSDESKAERLHLEGLDEATERERWEEATAVGDARKRQFSGPLHSEDVELPPTTPRLARSVDDLRVGQTIVRRFKSGWGSAVWKLSPGDLTGRNRIDLFAEDVLEVVILADPPAPPTADWLVSADKMEALREVCDESNEHLPNDDHGCPCPGCECIRRARALLDAATEVER